MDQAVRQLRKRCRCCCRRSHDAPDSMPNPRVETVLTLVLRQAVDTDTEGSGDGTMDGHQQDGCMHRPKDADGRMPLCLHNLSAGWQR